MSSCPPEGLVISKDRTFKSSDCYLCPLPKPRALPLTSVVKYNRQTCAGYLFYNTRHKPGAVVHQSTGAYKRQDECDHDYNRRYDSLETEVNPSVDCRFQSVNIHRNSSGILLAMIISCTLLLISVVFM